MLPDVLTHLDTAILRARWTGAEQMDTLSPLLDAMEAAGATRVSEIYGPCPRAAFAVASAVNCMGSAADPLMSARALAAAATALPSTRVPVPDPLQFGVNAPGLPGRVNGRHN